MMTAATGQLCARARFWASLRVDGELSELEGALLDAHLGRCADCSAYAAGVTGTTVSPGGTTTVGARNVAVVSTVETPDQLRRLRRTSLLNQRLVPRDISREPY